MEELRERALGGGWRKLVVDGVTATPVDARARPGGQDRRRGAHRDRRPRRVARARSTRCSPTRGTSTCSRPTATCTRAARRRDAGSSRAARPSSDAAPTRPRTTAGKQHPLPADHPLFRATKHLARQGAAGAALRRAPAAAAALGARADPRRRRGLRQGVHEPRARRVRPRGRHARRARRARRQPGGDRDGARRRRPCSATTRRSSRSTTIADYASDEPIDLLVSLHACDTATDEAIAAGVRLGADAIVVAPCCHHELAAQIATREKDGAAPARAAARPPGRPRHRRAARRRARDRAATAST